MRAQKKYSSPVIVILSLLALGLTGLLVTSHRHANELESKVRELESKLNVQAQVPTEPQQVAGPGVASSPSDRMIKDLSTRFIGDPRSISEKLRDFLKENPDFQHLAIACKVVADLADNKEALSDQELNWLYQQEVKPDLKRVVAQVLSRRGDNAQLDSYTAQYKPALNSSNPDERQTALTELAKTRYLGAANLIAPLLSEKDPVLLQNVMLALKVTGNESHTSKLKALLNHPDESVSWLAKDTLDTLDVLSKKAHVHISNADIAADLPPIMEQ
ncbi:MAG: HEAT repeat domain-containing protein [Gammaproteobacteria bacterium]|nr:MAG: HEAT repeat domain-containing protein [Gammaproteobacteria bacterium]